jgi:hypothetical protein
MKALLFLIITVFITPVLSAQKKGSPANAEANPAPGNYFSGVKWRNIGPFRGGRSVAAVGVENNPLTYYMGTVGGGVWKTEDAGVSWQNISDGQFKTSYVGAIAVLFLFVVMRMRQRLEFFRLWSLY